MAPRVAIVGGGLCGFVAYLTLRRAGVEDVTVFSPDPDPAATFRARAAAIRQTHMRSESDGHCLPTSFPGLAVRDVRAR
jgi:cation diffusion facilitator CzcD-associated flavoprotein CzcO